jgi:regulator of protease activity HflC (stomatin/prohibitin superfamily)
VERRERHAGGSRATRRGDGHQRTDFTGKTKKQIGNHMKELIDGLVKMFGVSAPLIIIIVALAIFILPQAMRILREYERGVIFRLGKLQGAKGPGLIFLIPVVDRMVRMDLRVVTIDVPKQEIMTKDNVPATVDAVIYFRVVDPNAAVVKVENYWKATSLISQTTLRSVLGQSPLDDLLSQRDVINQKLQEIIDKQTDPWGIKVTAVEVREVSLPEGMKRAMAKQAEAERERRAKVVNAEGEFQSAEKMVQAAALIAKEPIALQLRYLQTMREMASEHNTTTFLPLPIDLFSAFLKK